MAELEKIHMPGVGHILDHNERKGAAAYRDNVDSARSEQNYNLAPGDQHERLRENIEIVKESSGRKIRKNAVVLASWVVTRPKEITDPVELKHFFQESEEFLKERYGADNEIGAWVHMDETSPHLHYTFTPIREKENGKLAFDAATILDKVEYKSFHRQFQDYLDKHHKEQPIRVLLDDKDVRGKMLSNIQVKNKHELTAYRKEIDIMCTQIEAPLDDAKAELQATQNSIESLGSTKRELAAEITEAQAEISDLNGTAEALRASISEFQETKPLMDAIREFMTEPTRENGRELLRSAQELVSSRVSLEHPQPARTMPFEEPRTLQSRGDEARTGSSLQQHRSSRNSSHIQSR